MNNYNENNQNQDLNARAAAPGFSENLVDGGGSGTNAPAPFNIQMYNTNENGYKVTGDVLACDPNKTLFCKIIMTGETPFRTLTKATLKIRQSSGSAGDFAIQLSDENNTDYAQEKFNRTKQVVENGATYQVADIGYYLQNCENKTVYLAIKSQNGNYCSLYTNTSVYKPQIDVEYIDDDDFIPNVPTIENTVGSKGKYSINVRNGKLFYFQNIFTANGSRLPFNLSMTYNAADCDKNNPNDFQGTIKGWTFNYQQTLKKIDRDYIYLDGMHKYHRFTWAKNDIYIMPDVSACNGTILKSRNIPYEITDGKTTTLKFDQSNRLYEISVLRGSGSPICNTIAYDANGRLATVTDGENDTYSFSYATDKITIYKGLVSDENKKALVEIAIASTGTVSSVKNLLSQQIYTFTYTEENQLASVKDSASAQLTNFGYTSSGSIKSALSFVQKNEGQTLPVTGTFFTYKYRHTVVATAQNSADDSPATTRIGYFFDTNGELQHTAEWAVDQYKGLSHVNKTPFTTNIEQVQNATIHSFIFSDNGKGADTIDVQDFKLFLNPIQTPPHSLVLPTNQKYVFCGKACIENLDPQLETLTATLIAGNGNKLCTLEFDPNQKEFQFQSKSFDAYSGEAEYYVKLNVGKTQAHATVGDFKILLSSAPTVCTDQTVSGKKSHVERSSNGSKTWYEMKECTLYCDDEDYVENVAFTFKDYMLTKLSMLKNPKSYNVWFNDGRGMFINIEHTFLSFYLQPSFQLANAKFALLQSAANKTTFTHIEPPEDQGTYLTNFFKIKTVVNGVTTEQQTTVPFAESEEEYDQFFRVKKSIDVNGIETTYTFDSYGNTISSTTNPKSNTSLNVKQSFSYNSNGNLSTETDYRTWETYNTTYTYNDENLIASVKTPIDQTTNYTYTADNEKLQSISSTLAYPYYTATNNIVYSGDYVDSLTANDTTFRFTYDERNDIKSVSIRSTEDESVFNFESQSNFNDPWNASRTVTYGNGQKIRRYYDVYNRLIRVNDVTSTYKPLALYIYSAEELSKVESDEIKISNPNDYRLVRSSDAKLRRVIMPTSQSLAIVIDYTYDYSGQVTKTVEYNQAITTSDTNVAFNQSQQATSSLTVEQTQKDEYQRTTKTTATCNDITLVNSCTYESFVTDAVTQEKTEVKSGNSTLGTVQTDYTTDGLKRLQSVKVTVNGNGYSRDIAYVPRQTRTLIPGPGGGFEPVIKAKAAPIYKTETVGTTYYPSLVTTKELRNNSAVETESLSLTYDANGNIASYGYNSYTYDKFNRLTRENNYYLDKTITWEYDVGGNITSRKEYALKTSGMLLDPIKTDTYSYGSDWKDQLTSFCGKSCIYDLAGNPTTYKGDTLTWEGRLLKTYKKQINSSTISMNYTADGLRISKTVGNSSTSEYTYNGSTLVREKITYSGNETHNLTFLYNGEGLTGLVHNTTLYTYRKNLFGDIIAIYQGNTKVADYYYDAYGNCSVITNSLVGLMNPFRYRGYYYDIDLGLYYLQSRYYDPQTGRFINADDVSYLAPETIHGLNLYAYCLDNPLRFSPSNSVGKKTATFTSKTASALPKWIDVALTAIDHSFTVINPLRTAIAISTHQNLWDVMRLDGVSELPGTLSKVSTGVGWGLGILGGIISGYEKYNTGASLSSSIAGGIINTSISIGGMYAATGIATFAMGLLTATGIPGGIIVVAGAVVSILVGIAINHLLTKLEIAGNTIEGHLNNLLDWIIFWD